MIKEEQRPRGWQPEAVDAKDVQLQLITPPSRVSRMV